MPLLGYARVSTADQDTALQVSALQAAGVQRIAMETRSGVEVRPELEALLRELQPGDVLMVYKVDRLARSLRDLLRVLQAITDAGATFKSLTEPLETTTPAGRMLIHLLGAFAEFERSIIRERCAAGMVVARRNGVKFGRPRVLTAAQKAEVRQAVERGERVNAVAAAYKVSRDTVRRACGLKV